MTESPAVANFISQNQIIVLTRGIAALSAAGRAELKEVVHRLVGTLGSFLMDDAVADLLPLHVLLGSEAPSEEGVERERCAAVAALTGTLRARIAQA